MNSIFQVKFSKIWWLWKGGGALRFVFVEQTNRSSTEGKFTLTDPPPCLRHCMAFCLRYVSSLQELPPELLPMSENLTEEREIHLSPAGACQRSLKMWFCSVTIALCSVRWPHSQPLFITFHADFFYTTASEMFKKRAVPACSAMTIALCSMRRP